MIDLTVVKQEGDILFLDLDWLRRLFHVKRQSVFHVKQRGRSGRQAGLR